jgi:hypothetical protein
MPVNSIYLHAVGTGIASEALARFLKDYVASYKVLLNFDERFHMMLKNLIVLVQNRLQPLLERLTYSMVQISTMSRDTKRYAMLGVTDTADQVNILTEMSRAADQLLANLSKAGAYVQNFIVWVNKKAFKNVKNEEAERNPLFAKKCNVKRLVKFLQHPELLGLRFVEDLISGGDCAVEWEPGVEPSCYALPSDSNLRCLDVLTGTLEDSWRRVVEAPPAAIANMLPVCSVIDLRLSSPLQLSALTFSATSLQVATVSNGTNLTLFESELKEFVPN